MCSFPIIYLILPPVSCTGQFLGAYAAQHSLHGNGSQCPEGAVSHPAGQCADNCPHVQQGDIVVLVTARVPVGSGSSVACCIQS